MSTLFVHTCVNTYYSRHPDQSDSWDAGTQQTELECIDITLGDWTDQSTTYRDRIVTKDEFDKFDHGFVVVVRYSTGSTFGYSHGLVSVQDVFHEMTDAVGLCDAIEQARKTGAYRFSYQDKEYCTGQWTGYFESIDDIEIREVQVR